MNMEMESQSITTNENVLSLSKTIATSPEEAVIFEGATQDFTSLQGIPYYMRLTHTCYSPSFASPFLSLYLQCDAAETYEAQFYLLLDAANTILCDTDWTEALPNEFGHIINFIKQHQTKWYACANMSPYYIQLGEINSHMERIH